MKCRLKTAFQNLAVYLLRPLACAIIASTLRNHVLNKFVRWAKAEYTMKKSIRLLIALSLILPIVIPLPDRGLACSQSKGETEDAGKTAVRRATGWFRRPAEAGDFQEVVNLPNMERPETLASYLPAGRDLPAFCRAQSRAYNELTAALEGELSRFEAKRLSDLDPEILGLPRLYERLGNLA